MVKGDATEILFMVSRKFPTLLSVALVAVILEIAKPSILVTPSDVSALDTSTLAYAFT